MPIRVRPRPLLAIAGVLASMLVIGAGMPGAGMLGPGMPGPGMPGARSFGQERVVVPVLAERFSFTPSEIRVPAGVTLELRIRSDDTMHGFRIGSHGVDVAVPKRRQGEAVVEFDARTVGRYPFECSRLCGAGHPFMGGEIVVVEPDPND